MTLLRCHLLCLLLFIPTAAHACKLTFGVADHASPVTAIYFQFLQRVYTDLDCQLELQKLPGRRAIVETSADRLDGVMLLPQIIQQRYPNLYMIQPAIAQVEIAAFSLEPMTLPAGLQGLTVGLVRGYEMTQRELTQAQIETVENYDALFAVLQKGRVDVALALRREARRYLSHHPEYGTLYEHPQAVLRTPLYHFLSPQHQALSAKVSSALTLHLNTGELDDMLTRYAADTDSQ